METIATLKPLGLLALAFALTGALAAAREDVDAAMSREGLARIEVKNIDLAYARPGATLAAYKRIQLDPVAVEFSKRWEPDRTGSRLKISAQERDNIRAAVGRAVRDEFARELQATGNYEVVAEAGPGVLRVTPRIVNLYLNAADAGNVARTRVYMASAGELTLVAELADSTSSQLLVRLADRREADNVRWERTNGMVNENEIRTVAAAWARVVRQALDKAHAPGS